MRKEADVDFQFLAPFQLFFYVDFRWLVLNHLLDCCILMTRNLSMRMNCKLMSSSVKGFHPLRVLYLTPVINYQTLF